MTSTTNSARKAVGLFLAVIVFGLLFKPLYFTTAAILSVVLGEALGINASESERALRNIEAVANLGAFLGSFLASRAVYRKVYRGSTKDHTASTSGDHTLKS